MPLERLGNGSWRLTFHGAVHDKPDDKLDLFEYESFTRFKVADNEILLCAGGGCGPSLREEQPAAQLKCSHSTTKIGGDRSYNLNNLKQGIGPALFFGFEDGVAPTA